MVQQNVKDVFKLLELYKKHFYGKDLYEILPWFSNLNNRKNFFNSPLLLRTTWGGKFTPIIPLADCKSWNNYKIFIPFDKNEIDWTIKEPVLIANQIKRISEPDSMSIKHEFLYPYF